MPQPTKTCPRCQAIAHIEAPKCPSCGRQYVARFVLQDPPPPRSPRPSPPPPKRGFSPPPDIPHNRVNGDGIGISVAQVVSTATVLSEAELAAQRRARPGRKTDDQKLVKRLLAAAAAVTIVLAAIVVYVISRPLHNTKNDAEAIDAGSAAFASLPTATKWVDSPLKSDAQLQPGVKVSTPRQVPIVPMGPGPDAPVSASTGPLNIGAATDPPAPHPPVINLTTPSKKAKDKAAR